MILPAMLPLAKLRGNGLERAQSLLQLVQSGLATNPLWSSRLLAEHSSPRHPWPLAPTANWSMMYVVTSGSLFCNNAQYAAGAVWLNEAPNHPCASEDLRCSKPSLSFCPHHSFECSPHAFIMGIGIRLRLTGRNGPEEMVASRTGALEQDLPCALCVWHPRDCLPQSSLLLQPRLGNVNNELVRTDGSAQDLNPLRIPHIGAQICEVRWTCSCSVPRPGFAGMQLDSRELLAQQIVHLANPL